MTVDPQAIFSAFIVVAIMLLLGFPVHEGLHAWTASRLGDNTARWQGRVSLNPYVHLDQLGALVLAGSALLSALTSFGFLFGWAKPTPVNPMNLRYGRQGHALVAFAGPASNLVVAALAAIPIRIALSNADWWLTVRTEPLLDLALSTGLLLLQLNVLLFIFNMLPLFPLDGWSVLTGIVPESTARSLESLQRQYAHLQGTIFLGVIAVIWFTGILGPIITGISRFLIGT